MVSIDIALFYMINGWSGNAVLDALFLFLTYIGNSGAVWIALALLLLLGAGRLPGLSQPGHARWRAVGVVMLAALALSKVAEVLLKTAFARPRPAVTLAGAHVVGTLPASLSFPSGHALASFAAASVLLSALRWAARQGLPLAPMRDGWSAMALAALISFSRIYVGHHFPLDVLAGAAVGSLLGWVSWTAAALALGRAKGANTPALR
jgi:undecaprenyl-diphosphatase